MKKIFLSLVVMTISLASFAVPARRGFHDFQQPDGTTISLQLVGDEFVHWYESADGTVYKQTEDGRFLPANQVQLTTRRKAAPKFHAMQQRRAKQIGSTPNPAPKGVVILANFSNKQMNSSHTQAVFDELCNSTNCTVNSYNGVNYGSAAQYFDDQSNGAYRPQFDVFGPVTLSKNYEYYGGNYEWIDGDGEEQSEDSLATDAVIEACIKANEQYSNLNFADYDTDGDGKVDFVYVIYAGHGEADYADDKTIWPHNYSVQTQMDYQEQDPNETYTHYTRNQTKIDGKYLDNYACSSELNHDGDMCGIGTLCHEFGHVIGLPDFYDTGYGDNYANAVTPNDWDVMDGGSYNADGHCPPNYSPWEKYFFGWHTPINLGNEGSLLTLQANGTTGYQAYQITQNGNLITPTTATECYYIENRQQQGWDSGLPHHGMLIWKVKYNANAWENNTPNNTETSGAPLYTVVSASGSKIGTHINSSGTGYTKDGPKNPFPGSANVHSKTVAGKPLQNIQESNGVITLTYIEEPAGDPFDLTWMVGGTEFATTTSTGKIVLPANEPQACDADKVFVGWTRTANYSHATTAPTFVSAGEAALEGDIFYAVFANEQTTGSQETNTSYTFTTKAWKDATNSWTSTKDGNQLTSGQGVQVTANTSEAGAKTKTSVSGVTNVRVNYCTNASKGEGSITVKVGNAQVNHNVTKDGGTSLRNLDFAFNGASGVVSFVVTCTTNSIYVNKITITSGGSTTTYSNYTTVCGSTPSAVENTSAKPAVVKAIRNGQVVIIRDGQVFNLLGVQQ